MLLEKEDMFVVVSYVMGLRKENGRRLIKEERVVK